MSAVVLVLGLIVVFLYFVPTIVALGRRGEANPALVFVTNLFLGWTLIGWIVALVMALRTASKPQFLAPPG